MLMIIVFAVQLRWFPAGGSMYEYGLKAMILPSLALGLTMAALIMRMTRSSMLEVLGEDYVRTARAKGLLEFMVVSRHALSNALIPVVTVVGFQFGAVLGGAVLTEIVFSLPGLGRMMVDAINRRDYPLVEGGVLATSLIFVGVNLLVDVLYGAIDPRIRYD
jgi:peptide/nickel transport system permease protein